jgi:inner membrane protein
MDTITHLTLGACIAEAMVGKKIGRPALFVGAIAQSIPDLDFITGIWMNPPESLLAHRGLSHSFLFMILITPLLAWLVNRWHPFRQVSHKGWTMLIGIEILCHLFLDAFNAYGVGWFEPFNHARISFNILFVADPLFTIWSLVASLVLFFTNRHYSKRKYWVRFSLLLTGVYMLISYFNKLNIEDDFADTFNKKGISISKHFTTPTPFNNLLWYVVAYKDSGFYIGHHSVFDKKDDIEFHFHPMNERLLEGAGKQDAVRQLKIFSQGFYTAEKWADTLVFNDLRFGQIMGWADPDARFVFHYILKPELDNTMVVQRGRFQNWNWTTIRQFLRRIRGS